MTDPRPRHSPAYRLAFGPALGLTFAAAFIVGACNLTTPTPSPSSAPASVASVAPSAEASNSPGPSNPAPQVGQTDTDWGRIWDALPAAFPVYPGAAPAEQAESDPVSATFALEGQETKTVAAWMQSELERATYTTEALSGPLEDGSFVLTSTGSAGCRVQVSAAPLGSLTIVTVRYGAACPSP
jgi:hypothetical protein